MEITGNARARVRIIPSAHDIRSAAPQRGLAPTTEESPQFGLVLARKSFVSAMRLRLPSFFVLVRQQTGWEERGGGDTRYAGRDAG